MTTDAKDQERCVCCVLPKSARFISFNSRGLCELCVSRQPRSSVTVQNSLEHTGDLNDVISRVREQGRGRSFDCIVGVSGGRDSTYLLHQLVRKHDLRCLAAYHQTPFTPATIDDNVKRLVDKLNTPLLKINISKEFHRRIAREMVILWAKKPRWIFAYLACAPCKLHNREIFRIAKTKGVRWVAFGSNVFEAVHIAPWQPVSALTPGDIARREHSLAVQIPRVLSILKTGAKLLISCPGLWKYIPLAFQASVAFRSPDTPILRLCYPGISALHYFHYAEWKEAECEEILQEVGWELPAGYSSTWRADCTFAALKEYMLHQTIGLTYTDCFLSNLVRADVLSRDEALKRIQAEQRGYGKRSVEASRTLELSIFQSVSEKSIYGPDA